MDRKKGIGMGSLCVLLGRSLEDRQKSVCLSVAEKDCKYLFIIP